jgi:hypothetical protein
MIATEKGRRSTKHFNLLGQEIANSAPAGEIRPQRAFSFEGKKTMQVRALKRFESRYGPIRIGEIFTAEQSYGVYLVSKLMAEEIKPDKSELRQPDRRQVIPGAPLKKNETEPPPPSDTEKPQDDGPERPSALSRAARRLRKRTPSTRAPAVKP